MVYFIYFWFFRWYNCYFLFYRFFFNFSCNKFFCVIRNIFNLMYSPEFLICFIFVSYWISFYILKNIKWSLIFSKWWAKCCFQIFVVIIIPMTSMSYWRKHSIIGSKSKRGWVFWWNFCYTMNYRWLWFTLNSFLTISFSKSRSFNNFWLLRF